ncbi:signal recognition particle subunit srp68 [Trichoderma arundinaceum]|uniref:Signal recognition particle subunit SRP68 n=1 Tax=Trichoderma arundinaceum TaxID=490622 RepID=A0A395N8M8_TRIAR|nr:signal recognition particle subunit srp68 [Trichoderma arundinaceum]
MDITSFVVQGRDKALLYGDFSTYHGQLSKRLLNSRKKLGIVTKNRGKFRKAEQVTAEDVQGNHEHVYLLLLTSERAWAQAMSIKAAHANDQNGIVGRARSHIVSRLDKAARSAEHVVRVLSQPDTPGATTTDILEAQAYASLIRGAMQFEKRSWEACLRSYATTYVIYNALATASKSDIFKDLLSETVEPSIRFAAYQLKTPRTVSVATLAQNAFPRSDDSLVQEINRIDATILTEAKPESQGGIAGSESAPQTLTWRAHEVQIEDAEIATSWSTVGAAKERLSQAVVKSQDKGLHEVAAAYDEILISTQDAVDATKKAIDDLKGDGVTQSDPRMQRLQITRTAVNYEMISWRIGRNRVLTGPHDGATEEYGSLRRRKKKDATSSEAKKERELPSGKKLFKLKEKAALYDGILQNLESIKELPGVAADEELAARIEAYEQYFIALKHLAVARSHAIIGNSANALALINSALGFSLKAVAKLPKTQSISEDLPLSLDISPASVKFLEQVIDGELQRHRAIVHVDNLRKKRQAQGDEYQSHAPLVERLHEYPVGGADLSNIVEFPPKEAVVPIKPIFLDVAWNYIHYPGKEPQATNDQPAAATQGNEEPTPQPKRSWFGFGR